jgi:hypothetical protein
MRIPKFGMLLLSCCASVALLGLTGCGGDDEDDNGGTIIFLPPTSGAGGGGAAPGPDPQPTMEPEGGAGGEGEGGMGGGGAGGEGGGAGGDGGGAGGEGGDGEGGMGGEGPAVSCGGGEFATTQTSISANVNGAVYQGLSGDLQGGGLIDGVIVELREDRGTIEPGVYDLTGTNFSDCTICVVGVQGCNPQTGQCERRFYPASGQVRIDDFAGRGATISLQLEGVDLQEATITQAGSTFVPDGQTWCVEQHDIIGAVPSLIGDPVNTEFNLQNCETEEFVNLHELMGEKRALWLVATAGWCPACRQFIPQVINNLPMIGGMIEVIFVLGENAVYGQPDINYCRRYREHYDVPDAARFYIDHDGARSFATTFGTIQPTTPNGMFGLPWNAMIRANEAGDGWIYHYSDRADNRDINAALNELLR